MTQALTITATGTSDLAIGKEIVVNVDWSRVPADYLAHCLTKVTRDKLQDSHASIAAKDDANGQLSRAKAMKVLDSIYSGEFRLRGDGKTLIDNLPYQSPVGQDPCWRARLADDRDLMAPSC